MCGILAVFGSKVAVDDLRKRILELSSKLRHRGPDWNGAYTADGVAIAHERLAIVDLDNGAQPLYNGKGCPSKDKIVLGVNGEIYNHKALRQECKKKHHWATNSDCECIIHGYEELGDGICSKLDGMFSFVLYDHATGSYLAARDPIGITPLYMGWGKEGSVWFASELKALKEDCVRVQTFPPGHFYSPEKGLTRYYNPVWYNEEFIPKTPIDYEKIRTSFENAVVKRLMCDVPMGVLLSGGLDSSLVCSVVARHVKGLQWPSLHSFSIGLKESPDLVAARKAAEFLGTVHHEYHFTVQDGIDALRDVIWHLETYDVTTIRASTPMYFLSRKIKAMGVKMVLSGEGSDEVFGGYLYFHRAPDADEFHRETVRRVKGLHLSDCLRANKSTQAWGLEARVPFLDREFLDIAMTVDPKEKVCSKDRMEKYILRKAFDTPDKYLPDSILWRQKEQFSDGVGYSWITGLLEHTAKSVTDAEMSVANLRFPTNPPKTKEAYYYRVLFSELFPEGSCADTVAPWVPKWSDSTDPSGRVQGIHSAHSMDLVREDNNPSPTKKRKA